MTSTILIVDDNEIDQAILKGQLNKNTPYRILVASTARDCLKLLESESINLVLLDIMLPDVDGDELLLKIREKHNYIDLPIIMVTSKNGAADTVRCLKNGANDYITKPVNLDIAVSRLKTHLQISEQSKKITEFQKIEVLNALISTYNHEINNPLTVAISSVSLRDLSDENEKNKLATSLWRIAEIMKKIQNVIEEPITYEEKSNTVKHVHLK